MAGCRDEAPVGTLARSATTQTPHLTQPGKYLSLGGPGRMRDLIRASLDPGQDLHVSYGTASQSAQVIAPFQHRDDAPLGMRLGRCHYALGDPCVIRFHETERSHVVFAMRVETGGNEQ